MISQIMYHKTTMNRSKQTITIVALILSTFIPAQTQAFVKATNYEDFTSWYLRESGRIHKPYTASAIIDAETLAPLHYHAELQPIPTASLVKIFTADTLLLYPQKWNELISFTEDHNEGLLRPHVNPDDVLPIISLEENDSITREDAFAGMMIASANNAPYALAMSSAFSLDEFMAVMNSRTKELGMVNTNLVEPSGLSLNNMSTAQDLVHGGCLAYREELVKKYAGYSYYKTTSSLGNEKLFSHTLLSLRHDLDYSIYSAAKTGYLDETGYHVMAQMKTEQGKELCAVVLGADSRSRLDEMLQAMRDWVDTNYAN